MKIYNAVSCFVLMCWGWELVGRKEYLRWERRG